MKPTMSEIYLQNKTNVGTIKQTNVTSNSTYHLTDNPKIFEIQRKNNFYFYVSGLTGTLDIPTNKYAEDNADDVIKLSVSSSSVPHFTQTTISVKRGNNEMKFAGTPSFGDGTIKLNDWIGAGTKDVLLAWQRLSYNVKTEKVGLAADYKRDAYLLEYTPDDQLVTTWVLKGCWISGLSEDGFDHESNEKNVITATITYDKAYIDDDWADEE